jgi:pimeloyl-ACP methyl ester carboxylesterase
MLHFQEVVVHHPSTPAAPLACETHGHGAALLLLHGALVDRSYWKHQRDAFAEHYQVISCDLPGHGDSPSLTGPTSVAQFAQEVLATLDALRIPQAICVGHSLGGMVAQELALAAPERVRGLVLADTWYHPRGEFWEPLPLRTVGLQWTLRMTPVASMVTWMAYGLAQYNPAITPYALEVMGRYNLDRESYLHIWDAAIDFSTLGRLQAINCPTLVVVSDSFVFTRPQADWMARRIPGAELAVIDRSGHWVNWDNPDGFNQAVLGFLSRRCSEARAHSL